MKKEERRKKKEERRKKKEERRKKEEERRKKKEERRKRGQLLYRKAKYERGKESRMFPTPHMAINSDRVWNII